MTSLDLIAISTPSQWLDALPLGARATIVAISERCPRDQKRRLLDLGFVPGTEVYVELRSPAGDPTGYRIRGTLIALRAEQAEWIEVSANKACEVP
jgi:Fe2+ transport system protein FeoA